MFFIRLTVLMLLCGMVFAPRASRADFTQNAVVVLHTGEDPMTVRLGAELEALGYRPLPIHYPEGALTTAQVKDIIVAHRAIALVDALAISEKVDVWITDPVSRNITLAETVTAENGEMSEASMFLKAVELLRARLMKFDPPAALEKKEPVARPDRREPEAVEPKTDTHGDTDNADDANDDDDNQKTHRVKLKRQRTRHARVIHRQPHRLALDIGPGVTYGFSSLPPSLQVVLGAHLRLLGPLELDLIGSLPTMPMRAKTASGSARVWNTVIAAGPRLNLLPERSRVIPWLSALVGPHITRMKGNGAENFTDGEDLVVVAGIFLRAGLNMAVADTISIETAIHGGWAVKRPVVVIGEERVPFGNPLLGGSLALVVGVI